MGGAAPAVARRAPAVWLWAAAPLVLLALLLWAFLAADPLRPLTSGAPPVEDLAVTRIELGPYGLRVHVTNGGAQPVTVAQVLVDEAYWTFEAEPGTTLPRLGSAVVTVPYPWVEGEAHEVRLVTSTGATFGAEVEVAVPTPRPGPQALGILGLTGFFMGIVPVGLGLLWYPVLRGLDRRGVRFVLALTVGLLAFLLVDTVQEALELAEGLPGAFSGPVLVWAVALAALLGLLAVAGRGRAQASGLAVAGFLALGIGLHNLGEGMAVGAAFAVGEAALGSFLVVGFTLHNLTEGIGIAAPLARDGARTIQFVGLTVLAGSPAIAGVWAGAFSFHPLVAVLFLSLGAGAIAQVMVEVGRILRDEAKASAAPAVDGVAAAGLLLGLAVMYGTSLLVAV